VGARVGVSVWEVFVICGCECVCVGFVMSGVCECGGWGVLSQRKK